MVGGRKSNLMSASIWQERYRYVASQASQGVKLQGLVEMPQYGLVIQLKILQTSRGVDS